MPRCSISAAARLGTLVVALLVTSIQVVAGVGAPEESATMDPGSYEPGRSQAVRLGLDEALSLTLKYNAQSHLAGQRALEEAGRLRESAGAFDASLSMTASIGLESQAVNSSELKLERVKRDVLRLIAEEFQNLADALRRQSDAAAFHSDATRDQLASLSPELLAGLSGLPPGAGASDDRAYDFWEQPPATSLMAADDPLIAMYEEIAANARRGLRQFGLLPKYEDKETISLGLGLSKAFHNGLILNPGIDLRAKRDNFRGKGTVAWGGKGIKDNFRSTASVALTIPLGKGRGSVSVGAVELAGRLNQEAALNTHAFTISEGLLQTSLAYWKLLQAQEQLGQLSESADTAEDILSASEILLAGGQITNADVSQVRALSSESQARAQAARHAVLQARLALADAIGLQVTAVEDAPLVSSSWPEPPDSMLVALWRAPDLARIALANRADLAAARKRDESAKIMAAAARADLKRRKDLAVSLSFRRHHEGGDIEDPGSLLRSFGKSLFGSYPGPSFTVQMTFDLPVQNSVAEGRYVQARSMARQSEIQEQDLARVAADRIAQLAAAVARAASEVSRREEASAYAREILDTELDKFRAGQSTVVTMIRTEQDLVSKASALSSARQTLASLMSQLRFETGTLLPYRITKGELEIDDVRPLGYDIRS